MQKEIDLPAIIFGGVSSINAVMFVHEISTGNANNALISGSAVLLFLDFALRRIGREPQSALGMSISAAGLLGLVTLTDVVTGHFGNAAIEGALCLGFILNALSQKKGKEEI